MIVTNTGRPLGHFPLWKPTDGDGRFLLTLSRIDVSDAGNAEAFYTPLVVFRSEDQMTTVEVRLGKRALIIFVSPRKVNWHVQETEQ